MIDERMEELASLYVLGVLSPAEQNAFEAELARNPELQALVASLRAARDAIVGIIPAIVPPPDLKQRILVEAARRGQTVPVQPRQSPRGKVVNLWLPWALAAAALFMLFVVNHDRAVETKALQAELSSRSTQIEDLNRLADALRASTNTLQQAVAALQETNKLQNVRIALLGSLLTDSPKAVAVSLWDNQQQSGVFVVQNLKPLPPDRDYQLWVIDPKYKIPVSAGVFQVDNQGDVRIAFKANKTIVTADKFAVTLEPKGGLPTPTLKNLVLLGG